MYYQIAKSKVSIIMVLLLLVMTSVRNMEGYRLVVQIELCVWLGQKHLVVELAVKLAVELFDSNPKVRKLLLEI